MIDRTLFVPPDAPADTPYPFGYEQTVPTEVMVKVILEHIPEGCTVLEVGAGSGYTAASLAEKASQVTAVEVQPVPRDDVQALFRRVPGNVNYVQADGCNYDSGQQFDRIVVSFAAPRISHVWFKQLKPGGKLIVPIASHHVCRVCLYEKRPKKTGEGHELILVDVLMYASFTAMVSTKESYLKGTYVG